MDSQVGENLLSDTANPFIRIPSDLKYKIFARLDAKDLLPAKSVSIDWNHLLNRHTIHALTLNPNFSTTSSFFLVKLSYELPLGGRRKKLYVGVDHSGRWKAVDTLNAPLYNCPHACPENTGGFPDWDSSSHGLLVSFPKWSQRSDNPDHRIIVCHPSLRWFEGIPFDRTRFTAAITYSYAFRGACYDPSTSHFTLLLAWKQLRGGFFCGYEIHIYSSKSKQWKITVREAPPEDDFHSFRNENGLFSQGCFFWLDKRNPRRDDRAVVVFDLSDERLHRMPLPKSRLYPIQYLNYDIGNRYFRHNGELKGCDGNMVFFHYSTGNVNDDDYMDSHYNRSKVIVGWRLEQSGSISNWKWHLAFLRRSFRRLNPSESVFNTDRSGWWLWSDLEGNFLLMDGNGEMQHLSLKSDMRSLFRIPTNSYLKVDNIWVLDTNNIWDMLAFSFS